MKRTLKTSSKKTQRLPRWQRTIGGYSSLKYVAMLVVGVGFVGTAAALTFWQPQSPITNPLGSLSHTADAPDVNDLLREINQQRHMNNLPDVTLDPEISLVADTRAKDMVTHQYYAHQNLQGLFYYDLLSKSGIPSTFSCENLDIGASLQTMSYVQDWLQSTQGHKECMLNKRVSKIGLAATKFSEAQNGLTTSSYLVVAIFVEPQK